MRSLPRSLILGAACLAAPASLEASTIRPVSLRQMVVEADLIAEARVIDITHKNADVVEPGDSDMPHTFVTFAIERIAKGSSTAGDTITLRFLGGRDGKGKVLLVAGMPQFRVGDRDLLFIRDNGSALCPLLGWEHGRLRMIRGAVYDHFGSEVWISPKGNLVRGSKQVDVRAEGYPAAAAETDGEEAAGFVPPVGSVRPDPSGMHAVIGQLLLEARLQGKSVERPAAESQDPAALLRVPRFVPGKPPAEPAVRAPRRTKEPGDEH